MKKTLFILPALALAFVSNMGHAQLINPDFETWTADFVVPTAMNPNSGNGTTGWWDYNFFNSPYLGSSPVSITRSTDTIHSGTYSARVETKVYTPISWNYYKDWGIPFIGHVYSDTLGVLFNGNVNTTTVTYKPGIPFTQKITQLSFYYQYKPNGIDTAECRVALVKSGVPVAGGVFKTNGGTGSSGWQQAVVNLSYINSLIPDTLWILYSASSLDGTPKVGSVLWIDDVSVTMPTGLNQVLETESAIEIFPNPTNGIFSIRQQTMNNKQQTIEIYNLLGENIYSILNNKNAALDIDISHSPSGIYFVKINEEKTNYIKKIVVQ